jgi:hypothetical protein
MLCNLTDVGSKGGSPLMRRFTCLSRVLRVSVTTCAKHLSTQ